MITFHNYVRRLLLFAAALLSCLAGVAQSSAQSAPPPPATSPASTPLDAPTTQSAPTTPSATASAGDLPVGGVIRRETRLVLVDTVVTDKKGKYVRDLTQKDFKVFEDNKEQTILSFTAGTDQTIQANGQRRYLILFFDNSTMDAPDQIQARGAAAKFIDANASPDHLMAVVDFGGSLRIVQNFTANAAFLQAAVSGLKGSYVDPNAASQPVTIASTGISSLNSAEADFGARSMLLALRSLAKNLRSVPGRKMLVLFSGGFPLTGEAESELTATIDACNKANVAIYALDARGLVATTPGGKIGEAFPANPPLRALNSPADVDKAKASRRDVATVSASQSSVATNSPRLILA